MKNYWKYLYDSCKLVMMQEWYFKSIYDIYKNMRAKLGINRWLSLSDLLSIGWIGAEEGPEMGGDLSSIKECICVVW